MFNWFSPSKSPTPSEWAVLMWAFVVLLILAGVAGLIISAFVPPEKHELALELAHYGFRSLGVGLVLGVGLWAFRRFVD